VIKALGQLAPADIGAIAVITHFKERGLILLVTKVRCHIQAAAT
jgi:hypothetical protein